MISLKTNNQTKQVATAGKYYTITAAQQMINRYQEEEPDGLRSFMYGRHMFEMLLQAPQCKGIRIFNAFNEEHNQTLIFTAADANGEHITNCELRTANGLVSYGDPITGGGGFCPFDCPKGGDGLEIYIQEMHHRAITDLATAGEMMPRRKAQEMIQAYQAYEPDGVYSILLGREIFETILNVPGCAGIRIFNGINDDGLHCFIVVPINAEAGNILKYMAATASASYWVNAPLASGGILCPFDCAMSWE